MECGLRTHHFILGHVDVFTAVGAPSIRSKETKQRSRRVDLLHPGWRLKELAF